MEFFKNLALFAATLFLMSQSAVLKAQNTTTSNNNLPQTIYHFPPPMDDPGFPFKTVTVDANTPQWAKMLYEVNPNIKEVRKLHWQWRKNNPNVKNGHTRNFKKLSGYLAENDFVSEAGYMEFPTGEELKAENKRILADHKKAKQNQANHRSDNNTTWQLIGPTYKKTTSNNLVNRQINIYSLTQSLSNMNILYCTSESGGTVFKTINHGDNWFSVSDDLITNMGSRNIEVAPSDPDIVYLCAKHDIFKTSVGGNEWESIYYEWNSNNRTFIIHPTNPDIIFAGGDNGILKSIDGGANWTNPLPNVSIYDLRYKPGDTQTIYALVNNSTTLQTDFYKSTDGGETWTVRSTGWPNEVSNGNKGGQMTTSDGNPEYIYAFVGANWVNSPEGVNIKILNSTDSGESWTTVVDYDNDFGINDGQGYYDWDIEMSDTDPDVLYGGTQGKWVTLNGFQTVNENTGDLGHADVQETLFNGSDLWVVNDGGIILFEDETFQNYAVKSKGINAISYWSFDQAWNQDVQVGTHYHNGTSANHENYEANMAINFGGAEPSFSLVAQPSGDKIVSKGYGSVNGYTMPDEQTGTFSRFSYNIEPNQAGYDGTNIEVHPNYYDTHFAALENKVMKSENFGSTWEELAEFTYADEYVEDIKMSRANTNVMWVGTTHSSGSHLYRSADGGASFVEVPQPNGFSANNFQISVSNTDEDVVYIGGDNKVSGPDIVVAKTLDGGATWINLWTPALANYDFRRILQVDGTDGGVYVLTSRGTFYRNNTLPDWVLLADGMAANTSYGYIKPFYRDKALRIATARGIYGAELYDTPQLSDVLIQPTVQKYSTNCARDTFYFDDFSVLEHAGATWSWSFPGAMYVSATDIRNPKVVYGQGGEYDVTLSVSKNGQTYSKTIEKMVKIGNDCSTVDDFAGMALHLNGDTEDRALIEPMDVTTNTFTFTAWVKPEDALRAFSGIFTNGVWCAHCNDQTLGLSINYHGDRLYYRWPGSTSGWAGASSLTLPVDEWSYVAMIMTPDKVTLMVNEEKWEDNRSHDPVYLGQLYFGDGNYSGFFNGAIDEATFWKRALTEQEVKELMHLTKDPSGEPDLLAYYQFNEPSGDILDKAGIHSATLLSNAQRIVSPIPVGAGFSQTQTANTGTVGFNDASFEANFTGTSVEVVASKINNTPFNLNGLIVGDTPLANEYWAVHRYGTGDFTADLIFKTSVDISSVEAANPCQFALYQRANRSADDWEFVASATSADEASDKVTFNVAVEEWSQYLVVKSTQAILRANSPLVLKNTVLDAISVESSYTFSATNLSNDVQITAPANFEISTTSGSSFGTNLTLNPSNGKIAATTIYVRFSPTAAKLYSDNIVHSSNGASDLLVEVSANGITLDRFPGMAMDFDGDNDYILTPATDMTLNDKVTLEFWLDYQGNMSTNTSILELVDANNTRIVNIHFPWSNSRIYFDAGNTTGYDRIDKAVTQAEMSGWNHWAFVKDAVAGTMKIYRNGEIWHEGADKNRLFSAIDRLFLGRAENGYRIDAKLDEFKIWNTARTQQEIRENMHLTAKGDEAGLILYYQFNEADGNALDPINNFDGELRNGAVRVAATEPVGGGFSNTQTEANDGSTSMLNFPSTGFEATVSNQNEAEIVASKIQLAPNDNVGIGANEAVADNQYWVVTRYGTGTFTAHLSFTLVENLTAAEETSPNTVQLYGRNKTSDGNWTLLAAATSVDATNNIANFENIAAFEQYLVTRNPFPKITVSQPSFSFGNIDKNTHSAENSYVVSASELTADLIINAPSGFEISLTSGADFSTSLTLTPSGNDIAETTIYVRFSPSTKDYQSGEITHTSTGAMDKNISIDGTGIVPEIELRQAATILTSGETIDFSNHAVGESEAIFFTIKNTDLGNLNLISDPNRIVVSGTDASDFVVEESTTAATISTNGETTFKLRFTPSSSGVKTATINIANNDDDESNYVLNLRGEGDPEPIISITSLADFEKLLIGEISTEMTYTVSGSHLLKPLTITSSTGFEISLTSGSGLTNTLTLHPVNGTLLNTTIYVRFVPTGINLYQGTILHTSENATTQTITTNGSSYKLAETIPGNAIEFNGTSDYVSIPYQPIFNFGEDIDFTVALWMKTDNWRNDASLASNKDWDSGGKDSWNIALATDGQGIDVNVGDGSGNRADLQAGNLNDGEWHHIAATFDRDGDVSLYVDGVLEESTSVAHVTNINSGLPITFGRDSENEYFFEGLLDEAKIWTRALTAEQVRAAMHITSEWNTPDLIAYYQFNETTRFGSIFNLKDNLHGAMYGGNRVESTAAVGGGFVHTQTEIMGNIDFGNTDVNIDFMSESAEVVVAKINLAPNAIPTGLPRVFENQYWAIHRYGTGDFAGNITFEISEDLTSDDEANPSDIVLYGRAAHTDSPWQMVTTASTVDAINDEVTFDNLGNLEQFIIAATTESSALPLEWLYATAQAVNKQTLIKWATATETNTKNYLIEWSINGQDFQQIAKVETEHRDAAYTFLHQNPVLGINYYRILQVDKDGDVFYTPVMFVEIDDKAEFETSLFPNPASDLLQVYINGANAKEVQLYITNVSGQTIKALPLEVNKEHLLEFNVSHLPSGIYFLKMTTEGQDLVRRFVVR